MLAAGAKRFMAKSSKCVGGSVHVERPPWRRRYSPRVTKYYPGAECQETGDPVAGPAPSVVTRRLPPRKPLFMAFRRLAPERTDSACGRRTGRGVLCTHPVVTLKPFVCRARRDAPSRRKPPPR